MREQPRIKRRIPISLRPGVMLGFGIDGELHLGHPGLFQGVHHALGFLKGHHVIPGAVEGPHAQGFERRAFIPAAQDHADHLAAAANGHDGGKPFREGQPQIPGAIAAHAQAGEINPARIHRLPGHHLVQQRQHQVARPRLLFGALRRNDDEREIRPGRHVLERAVGGDFPDIRAALARAVQKQDQGPAPVRLGVVAPGQIQQVINGGVDRFGVLELVGGLRGRRGGRGHDLGNSGGGHQQQGRREGRKDVWHNRDFMGLRRGAPAGGPPRGTTLI